MQVEADDHEPAAVMLLRDMSEIFANRAVKQIATNDIISELLMLEDRPWSEWKHGKPLTAQSMAALLKPFGIRPKASKKGGFARGYVRNEIEAAAARYAPATHVQKPATPQPLHENNNLDRNQTCNPEPEVAAREVTNALKEKEGCRVAAQTDEGSANDPLNNPFNPDAWQ